MLLRKSTLTILSNIVGPQFFYGQTPTWCKM
jgi:hypothetical protein